MNKADNDKDNLSPDRPSARQIARRLISSHPSQSQETGSAARTTAAATDHLYRELCRWVGHDGCHALFTRALSEARAELPALRHIHLNARGDPYVDGVSETIMQSGDPAAAEALESMLTRLIGLLARLIGDDMATILIERSLAASESADRSSDDRQEEA